MSNFLKIPVNVIIVMLKKCLFTIFLLLSMAVPRSSWALSKNFRLYITTSAYGTMAGAITGIGSLAFYESPSKHLNNVAMGASLGLYVGILMGTYMIYLTPDEKAKANAAPATPNDNPLNVPEEKNSDEESDGAEAEQKSKMEINKVIYAMSPIVSYDYKTKRGILGLNLSF